MPTISIVTPFSGDTAHLIADFYRAVEGSAQVVVVDNACPQATASTLVEMTTHLAGEYVRSETNLGFAAGNNAGYANATGDIVVFLNSDVAPLGPWLHHVARDVRDGALYGPSLQAQLVAGRHLPYIEGWCIAATRETWDRILTNSIKPGTTVRTPEGITASALQRGPWDSEHYPGPYWEDNDLCLRALQAGFDLVQTAWPIHHKGGQTAGPIMRHGESFARNEHTFTQRVLQAIRQPSMSPMWARYMQAYHTPSDIQHHIGLLYSLARGNVVELGTRTGVSTAALLAGVERSGGFVWSIDIADCGALFDHKQWRFIQGDSADPGIVAKVLDHEGGIPAGFDLLLIDTEHTYEQASAELALWSRHMRPGGRILLHDPETFPGVRRAVEEFCEAKGWDVTFVLPCNGMAIVEVPSE